jgi:uncharacterized iron-regulated membrane protein
LIVSLVTSGIHRKELHGGAEGAALDAAAFRVMAIMAIAGLIYPLVGLSMLAGLVVERLYELTRRAFARRVLQ